MFSLEGSVDLIPLFVSRFMLDVQVAGIFATRLEVTLDTQPRERRCRHWHSVEAFF